MSTWTNVKESDITCFLSKGGDWQVCVCVLQSVVALYWCVCIENMYARIHYIHVDTNVDRCLLAGVCRVVQCGAVWCSVVQCGAVCCSVLQCVADCNIKKSDMTCFFSKGSDWQMRFLVLQCVAVCCSVWQCVVVCCIVLKF